MKKAIAVLSAAVFITFFILWIVCVMARPCAYSDAVRDNSVETLDDAFPVEPLPDGRIFWRYEGPYPRNLTEDPYPYIPTETPKPPPITLFPPLELEDWRHSCEMPPLRFGRR